jgi:hypothetical protein
LASWGQHASIAGKITSALKAVEKATIEVAGTSFKTLSDSSGYYKFNDLPTGTYKIKVSSIGFAPVTKSITVSEVPLLSADIELTPLIRTWTRLL